MILRADIDPNMENFLSDAAWDSVYDRDEVIEGDINPDPHGLTWGLISRSEHGAVIEVECLGRKELVEVDFGIRMIDGDVR